MGGSREAKSDLNPLCDTISSLGAENETPAINACESLVIEFISTRQQINHKRNYYYILQFLSYQMIVAICPTQAPTKPMVVSRHVAA
jgi:hypothetical protein